MAKFGIGRSSCLALGHGRFWERIAARLVEVELEDFWNHQHGLRPATIFKKGKSQGFGPINEQATTTSGSVAHDPVSATVSADEK
jgi:hypothetical protein